MEQETKAIEVRIAHNGEDYEARTMNVFGGCVELVGFSEDSAELALWRATLGLEFGELRSDPAGSICGVIEPLDTALLALDYRGEIVYEGAMGESYGIGRFEGGKPTHRIPMGLDAPAMAKGKA